MFKTVRLRIMKKNADQEGRLAPQEEAFERKRLKRKSLIESRRAFFKGRLLPKRKSRNLKSSSFYLILVFHFKNRPCFFNQNFAKDAVVKKMQKRECFVFCSVLSKKAFKKQDMVFFHDMAVMRKHTNNKQHLRKQKTKETIPQKSWKSCKSKKSKSS